MAGPKVNRDDDRDLRSRQREVVEGLNGASATRTGEHGHAVSASVVDTIAANYRGKFQGFNKALAAKVAGSQRFDPPGVSERMAEAARHSASGQLDFSRAWARVEEASVRSKDQLKTYLGTAYTRQAADLRSEATKDLRKGDGPLPPERRLEIGQARAKDAMAAFSQGQRKERLAAMGGAEHVEAVLARLYAGGEAVEGLKGHDPLAARMFQQARTGLKDNEAPAEFLTRDGSIDISRAQSWVVGSSEDPLQEEIQREAWRQAFLEMPSYGIKGEAESRLEAGEAIPQEVVGKLKIASQLDRDSAMISSLDMSRKDDRQTLWRHLKEVDPGKAAEQGKEANDLALFRLKAMWNSEKSVQARSFAASAGHFGKFAGKSLKTIEGMAENILQALHAAMEMQDHAARGAVSHLAMTAWRSGSTLAKAPGSAAAEIVGHGKDSADQAAATFQNNRAKAQQSMGIFLAKHEMAERMADLAQANAKEGLEVSYDYARAYLSAAESRQQASQTTDPVERERLQSASRQARREMDVHLDRLRAEHPEFHDLLANHSGLKPSAVDQALERIGNPQVSVNARLNGRAQEAGLHGGEHGEWNPFADLGALSDGRRALGSVQGDWVEISALGADGRGEPFGRIKASDFGPLFKAHAEAAQQSERGGGLGTPPSLTPEQAHGWALLDRLDKEGLSPAKVGGLAELSSALGGHPELLSARNPFHALAVKEANRSIAGEGGDAHGLVLKPQFHARNELAEVHKAVQEVTYKTPMELQAFLERVVAMHIGDAEAEMNEAG